MFYPLHLTLFYPLHLTLFYPLHLTLFYPLHLALSSLLPSPFSTVLLGDHWKSPTIAPTRRRQNRLGSEGGGE